MKTYKEILAESSLTRVWEQSQKHDYGTISAYRSARDCGMGERYTRAENQRRNKVLLGALRSKGYSVTKIKGIYIENYKSKNEREVKEESFLVVDIQDKGTLKSDLMALGEQFDQDSIVFGKAGKDAYLIGTNKCPDGYPGYHKEEKLGHGLFGRKGEFYSRVNGRPFVFTESLDITTYGVAKYPSELRGPVLQSRLDYQ